jgi:hypothetical protein
MLATIILENYERISFSQHKILKISQSFSDWNLPFHMQRIDSFYGGELYQVIVATCFLVGIPVKKLANLSSSLYIQMAIENYELIC